MSIEVHFDPKGTDDLAFGPGVWHLRTVCDFCAEPVDNAELAMFFVDLHVTTPQPLRIVHKINRHGFRCVFGAEKKYEAEGWFFGTMELRDLPGWLHRNTVGWEPTPREGA